MVVKKSRKQRGGKVAGYPTWHEYTKSKYYQNGKIYKIEDVCGNISYVGSTTKELLCHRMADHRAKFESFQNGTSTTK